MAAKLFGRPVARRFLVAIVAVLLFAGWFWVVSTLLTARPRVVIDHPVTSGNVLFSPDSKLVVTWGRLPVPHRSPMKVWDTSGTEMLAVAHGWDHIGPV